MRIAVVINAVDIVVDVVVNDVGFILPLLSWLLLLLSLLLFSLIMLLLFPFWPLLLVLLLLLQSNKGCCCCCCYCCCCCNQTRAAAFQIIFTEQSDFGTLFLRRSDKSNLRMCLGMACK